MNNITIPYSEYGKTMTAIPLGPDSMSLPRSMFQGGKEPGYLVAGDQVSPWYWEGIQSIKGMRCIYSSVKNLKPLGILHSSSLPIETRLALFSQLLSSWQLLSSTQPDVWVRESFPLTALWIIPNSGMLVLPRSIAEVMMNAVTDTQRDQLWHDWVHPKVDKEQGGIYQLVSLLYGVLTQRSPFGDPHVQDAGYEPLPLWMLNPGVDDKTSHTIMEWLQLKQPLPSIEELRRFLSSWTYNITRSVPVSRQRLAEQQRAVFEQRIRKQANKSTFLRKRGFTLAVIALLVIIAAAGITHRIVVVSRPPSIAGLGPEEVITFFYESQSDINMEGIQEVLTRSAENVREQQLVFLHVQNSMNRAYGGSPLVSAEQWIEAGKPEVNMGTMVFGITDLDITPIGKLEFLCEFIIWLPDTDFEDEHNPPEQLTIRGTRMVERLILEDRGTHYMISNIQVMSQQQVY